MGKVNPTRVTEAAVHRAAVRGEQPIRVARPRKPRAQFPVYVRVPSRAAQEAGRAAARKQGPLFVGVVVRVGASLEPGGTGVLSLRDDAQFSASLGHDKEQVIEEGLRLVERYGAEKYELIVGTMSERVKRPTVYKVTRL